MRHAALLKRGNILLVFWTQVGDAPERILLSHIDLSGDWRGWKESEPVEVLRPELPWEGADAPLVPSVRSTAYGHVNQLRDPAILEDEGRIYLFYAVAGESGIALAEVLIDADAPCFLRAVQRRRSDRDRNRLPRPIVSNALSTKGRRMQLKPVSDVRRPMRGRFPVLRAGAGRQDRGDDDLRRHPDGGADAAGDARQNHPCASGRRRQGADGLRRTCRPVEKMQGFSVTLGIDEPAEAERVFNALADGGTVTMPIQETFRARRFGMLVDRFGTPWMVNCEKPA